MLAYVSINVNEQHVKEIAANYRRVPAKQAKWAQKQHATAEPMDVDVEPVPGTSSGRTG